MKFYKKQRGRYVPVRETIDTYGWPPGFYLVHVQPSSTSIRVCIEPQYPGTEAALKVCADAMVKAMQAACVARPSRTPITPAQQKAWDALNRAMGGTIYLQGCSFAETVEAGIAAVRAAIRQERSREAA